MDDPTKPQGRKNQGALAGRGPRFWFTAVLTILLIVFIAQNSQKVQVDFIVATTETPLIFALLIAGLLGALIGWTAPKVRGRRSDDE